MASQYTDHLSTLSEHAESRNAMAPPSQPTLPPGAIYSEQYPWGGFNGSHPSPPFGLHHDMNAHSLRYTTYNSTPFSYNNTTAPNMAEPTRQSENYPHPSLVGQESSGRTASIRPNE